MELHFRLTAADQRVLFDRTRIHSKSRNLWRLLWISAITLLLSATAVQRLTEDEPAYWQAAELFLVATLLALAGVLEGWWQRFGHVDRWLERFAGDYSLFITPAGLAISGRGRDDFVAWPEIVAFEETATHWLLHSRHARGIVVPKSALPSALYQEQFAAELRQTWQTHPRNRARILPSAPPASLLGSGVLADLGANLRAGYRFAVFRPLTGVDFRADGTQLALLLVLQLLVYGVVDWLLAGTDARFNAYGLTDFGAIGMLFLLSGMLMVRNCAEPASLVLFLVAVAASELTVYAIYSCLYGLLLLRDDRLGEWLETGLYLAWAGWILAVAGRAMVRLCGYPRPAALLPVGLFALFNLILTNNLPDEALFTAKGEGSPAPTGVAEIDGEALLYRQSALLEENTQDLAMERPGVTDLYFVGFAGEADERVFAHEIDYVRQLFDRKFGTNLRSVALVNSRDTADRLPLANAHNLAAVLKKLGKRMNRKEDVLFLFLTSHGSSDHQLSVRFPPLPLNDLSAARLKEILDDSGIRHRVIVVSACYSGGFLDALKDDYSLILTAASRDRPSFGCGTEADFTYFGSAFFVDALSDTRSFVDAFAKAKTAIEAREKAEGKPASLPQAHIGSAILGKLKALERRGGDAP